MTTERGVPATVRLRVADVMNHQVLAVRSDCSTVTAMRSTLAAGHTHVLVVDAAGRYLGLISVHSVVEMMFTPARVRRAPVSAVLGVQGLHTRPECLLSDAASTMLAAGTDALGVVDAGGLLVGLLSWADIVRSVATAPPAEPSPVQLEPEGGRAGRPGRH